MASGWCLPCYCRGALCSEALLEWSEWNCNTCRVVRELGVFCCALWSSAVWPWCVCMASFSWANIVCWGHPLHGRSLTIIHLFFMAWLCSSMKPPWISLLEGSQACKAHVLAMRLCPVLGQWRFLSELYRWFQKALFTHHLSPPPNRWWTTVGLDLCSVYKSWFSNLTARGREGNGGHIL